MENGWSKDLLSEENLSGDRACLGILILGSTSSSKLPNKDELGKLGRFRKKITMIS